MQAVAENTASEHEPFELTRPKRAGVSASSALAALGVALLVAALLGAKGCTRTNAAPAFEALPSATRVVA